MTNPPPDLAVLLAGIREQTRFELQLLHERVNTLLAAEAFLTIAYTATMNSAGSWAAVVAPILAGLGLLLAALAWPGVNTTARLVMHWTYQIGNLEEQHPEVQSASPTHAPLITAIGAVLAACTDNGEADIHYRETQGDEPTCVAVLHLVFHQE